MKHKPFKNIDEQIQILKDRKLLIDDEAEARNILLDLNYYRLSGYSLTLRTNDEFYSDVHFSDILQIYLFDRELKELLIRYLEDIEISLRTHIAYELGKFDVDTEAPPSYLDHSKYASDVHFEQFMPELARARKDNANEAFVKHHHTNYGDVLPTWAMVETLSFGQASRLFSSLSVDIQQEICSNYYGNLRYTTIENWLESLVVLRNICAHHSRLYNRGIAKTPQFASDDKSYFVSQGYDRDQIGNRLFFRLLIIERISPVDNMFDIIVNDIDFLMHKYPFVKLKHYGFQENWKEIFETVNKKYR